VANRTSKGNITAAARKSAGIGNTGKFPVVDQKSAESALKLRGHGKGVTPQQVIAKVAASPQASKPAVKAALKRARKNP
jgi:hypothetical protein